MSEMKNRLSSDRGKLQLASEDIYWFDEGKKSYTGTALENKEKIYSMQKL